MRLWEETEIETAQDRITIIPSLSDGSLLSKI
jgi:hypothetical protein